MKSLWNVLLTGGFSILVALIGVFGVWLKHKLDKRDLKKSSRALKQAVKKVGWFLNRYRLQAGAKRALLIRVHNAGNIRSLEGTKYLSVVDESYELPLESCVADFQRYRIDGAYRELVRSVMQDNVVMLNPKEMSPGFLRAYYENAGIAGSIVLAVHETRETFWYVSLNFWKPPDMDSPSVMSAIDGLRHGLNEILREHPEVGL